MKRHLICILAAVAAILYVSCKPDEKDVPGGGQSVPEIELQVRGNMDFPSEGGVISVPYRVINAVDNGTVSADSGEDWLSVSCGDDEVTVEVASNDGLSDRKGTVSVCYTYGEAGDTVMAHFDIVQLPGVQESDYDFEFEAAYFSGTYFGNIYGQNGEHCFDAYLMDYIHDGSRGQQESPAGSRSLYSRRALCDCIHDIHAGSFGQGGESQPWNHRLKECQDLPSY